MAVHHLDVGWRPADMTQRNGRIIRQGNRNKEVQVYQYVTEGTFDAYLYQTLENKQKFISQIMTSKSPVRSCDDVDEQALSYAEIKALCAGDPQIKEKMDLDVDVARLKVLKADHQSQQYRLEDKLMKYFPAEIEKTQGFIKGFQSDIRTVAAHPLPEEGFCSMEVNGTRFTEKAEAGEAILAACKANQSLEPVPLGSYRGFKMELAFDSFQKEYQVLLKGEMTHGYPSAPVLRAISSVWIMLLPGFLQGWRRRNSSWTILGASRKLRRPSLESRFPRRQNWRKRVQDWQNWTHC